MIFSWTNTNQEKQENRTEWYKKEPNDKNKAEEQFSSENQAKIQNYCWAHSLFNEIHLRYKLDTKLVKWTLYYLGHTVETTKTKRWVKIEHWGSEKVDEKRKKRERREIIRFIGF